MSIFKVLQYRFSYAQYLPDKIILLKIINKSINLSVINLFNVIFLKSFVDKENFTLHFNINVFVYNTE